MTSTLWAVAAIIFASLAFAWFINGIIKDRRKQAEAEELAINEALNKNRIADSDSGIDERVRKKYGHR